MRGAILWGAAVALAAGLALVPAHAGGSDTVTLSATRTLTLLSPSAFHDDDPADGWVLDGGHADEGHWLGVVRAQVSKFVANSGQCAPTGYVSLEVVSPGRSSYSTGVVFASRNGDSLFPTAIPLDGSGTADVSIVHPDGHSPLPQFLIVLGGSGEAPASIDVKLWWTGVANAQCAEAPAPTLTVVKHVVGGDASAGRWSLHVKSSVGADVANSPQSGSESGTTYTLSAGTFTVSESGGASGYAGSFSGDCNASGAVTLAAGDKKTCTLTNTAQSPPPPAPTLTVIKHVAGGGASAGRWSLHVKDSTGAEVPSSPEPGSESGTTYTLSAGTFTVAETGDLSGYTGSFSGDCDASGAVTLVAGDKKTCTLTNTAAVATGTLTVFEIVSGGSAKAADWQIHVVQVSGTDVSGSPEPGSTTGTGYALAPGAYTVSEAGGPSGYAPTYSGDCGEAGAITIEAGVAKTCTLTNIFRDTTPPVIHGPGDLTATATSKEGAKVAFEVTATDLDNPSDDLTIDCGPLHSGDTFPIGATTVTCNAHDPAGNKAVPVSFTVTVTDAAPVLSLPVDIHDVTHDQAGTTETFEATASDFKDGDVPVSCDHTSGDTFPVGTTTVHCSATNSSDQKTEGSFTVTVEYADTTPPVLQSPGDLTATATSKDGAKVTFEVTATDPDNPSDALTLDCGPLHSGDTFPIGTTTVTCNAHDPAGNRAVPVSFAVTVTDAPPTLSLPADIHDIAHAEAGNKESFEATASDFKDGPLPVSCAPESGSTFPVGTTTVHCSATNSSNQMTEGSFTVTVAYADTTPPAIHASGDHTATATSKDGTKVTFEVTATDPDNPSDALTLDCGPLHSGDTFPIETTTIACHAHDPAGNEAAPVSFTVTVNDAPPTLSLPADVHDVTHDPAGEKESFSVSATSFKDGALAVSCDHTSGETFSVGTTTVHCSATNSSNQKSEGAFTIEVEYVDNTAPVIHVPADSRVTATSDGGGAATYTVTASDPDDGAADVTLSCGPLESGATFPVGPTTITCNASDLAGNHSAPASFTITVDPKPAPPASGGLDLTVAVSGPALGRVGDDVSFSVAVKSSGSGPATGVEVRAQVPDGATLVSTTGPAACSGQTTVICVFGTVAGPSTRTQTIVLRPTRAGSLSLLALLSGEGASGSSSASTTVLEVGAPPPAPPTPPQPQTFNAIATGTILLNGAPRPSDTLFLIVSGDTIVLNGVLAITTASGNTGIFSNRPFTSVGVPGDADPTTFVVSTTGSGTTLTLVGGDFSVCGAPRRIAAKPPGTVVRQLWGRAKGNFTTKAKYSSATIRGTTWGVQDRCDGTLSTAVDDFVDVVDFVVHKTITLSPGETYLAKPTRKLAGSFRPPLLAAAKVRSQGLVWAAHRFRTKAELSAWLTSRGSSWRAFAAKYPTLAKALAARRA